MADKSQTINIVYKFNTAEIEKANQALNRANAATNKLQQDAAKVGQAGAGSAMDWSKSIAGLTSQMERLAFRAKNATNPADAKKYGEQWNGVKKQLDEATKAAFGFNNATKQSGANINNMVLSFRNLASVAGIGLLAGITKEAVDLTLSMATLKGQVEGVERGFTRAFENPVQVLNQVRDATQGTITDFDLMKRTLQATNLGVSVEHLGTLFEFAAARAQQTGESVDYLVDSIVRGIGRKSPLVLDNLGISVTALKEKFDGASIASKTVAEATEGVAEIAREQLEKMGGFVATAETGVKQLNVAWETLRISFAKKIDSSAAVTFFTQVARGLDIIIKGEKDRANEETKQLASIRLRELLENSVFRNKKERQLEQLDLLTKELGETQRLIRLKEKEIADFERAAQADPISVSAVPSLTVTNEQIARAKTIEDLKKTRDEYKALLPMIANTIRLKQIDMDLTNDAFKSLEKLRAERDKMVEEFSNIEDKDVVTLLDRQDLLKKAEDIKSINREIKALEDLLKEPKELKVKLAPEFEDDLKKLAQKFFDEGGGLKDVEFNPATGDIFDRKAFEATEVFDQNTLDAIDADVSEAADHIADSFWARLRLAMKREGGDSSQMQADLEAAFVELELTGIDIFRDQLITEANLEQESYDRRIRQARQFFETNQVLAGDNEQAKDRLRLLEDKRIAALRRKQFIAEQRAAKQSALINGAAAIVKTFATVGWPAGLVLAIAQAAATASQIAIIDQQQPRFAKGVINLQGRGTGTSDSIPARLSKGESVMTAWETKNSGGILKEIRAKKLDDRVLKNLRDSSRGAVAAMSDERIVKAIKDNRPPDVIEQSGIVYKATKKSEDYINKQRAKSVRI
jgi:hypothetical protein